MTAARPELAPVLLDWDRDTFVEHFDAVELLILEHGPERAADLAVEWFEDADPSMRGLALDLLAVLGMRDPRHRPVLASLARRAVTDADDDVRWSAAHALAAATPTDGLPTLLVLAADQDSNIRWQAVEGIATWVVDRKEVVDVPETDDAVRALLTLMTDDDFDVRRWAIFHIGVIVGTDGETVRDALMRATEECDRELAGDAARGLALRGDARVRDVLLHELIHEAVECEFVEAAADLGDVSLLPLLRALRESHRYGEDWSWAADVDYAIEELSAARDRTGHE